MIVSDAAVIFLIYYPLLRVPICLAPRRTEPQCSSGWDDVVNQLFDRRKFLCYCPDRNRMLQL